MYKITKTPVGWVITHQENVHTTVYRKRTDAQSALNRMSLGLIRFVGRGRLINA